MVGISSDNLSDHKITRPGLTMCYLLLLRHGEGTDGSSHHIHIPGVLACLALVSKVARSNTADTQGKKEDASPRGLWKHGRKVYRKP